MAVGSLSKLFGRAVHLNLSEANSWPSSYKTWGDSLRASPRYNACQEHLLRIVCDVWTQSVNDMSPMTIPTASQTWPGHPWLERAQNMGEGTVEKLSTKFSELDAALILLISCM